MAIMTVYRGGDTPVKNPEIRIGRNTKDLGHGFYCTIIKEQAQRWAKRYDTKIVSIYDVRLNSKLRIKEFREMTDERFSCKKDKAFVRKISASQRLKILKSHLRLLHCRMNLQTLLPK